MRRISSLFCALSLVLTVWGQSDIDRELSSFPNSKVGLMEFLMKEGFLGNAPVDITSKQIKRGKLYGRTCDVFVQPSQTISVRFLSLGCWKTIFYEYVYLKSMLDNAFGKPLGSVERMDRTYRNTGMEYWALANGFAAYNATYKVPNAHIKMAILTDNGYDGYVQIDYIITRNTTI